MKALDLHLRTALISLGQSVVKGGQLLVALVLVRLQSETDWAQMALLLSIYIAALGLGTLNIHHSIFFFYGRVAAVERRRLALQTIALLATSGLLCAGVVLGIAPWLGDGAFALGPALPLLALVLALEIPTIGTPQLLLAAERPGGAAIYDGVMSALQVSALVVPIALGHGNEGAFTALVGYAALRLVVSMIVVLRLFPAGRLRFDRRQVIEQLVYTAPLALTIGTSVLNRSLDKWIVAAFDPGSFGAYAVAAHEVPLVSIVPYAIGAVLATRMVHAFKVGDVPRVRAYWLAQTARMTLLVVPAAIGLILCAEELVTLLFTSTYDLATLPFQIYTVILLHRVAEYGLVLRAGGRTPALWWASATLLLANVAASVPLTWAFGMIGAALGTLLANAVAWIYVLRQIAITLETSMAGAFPWRLYLRVLGLSVAAAAGVAQLLAQLELPVLVAVTGKAALFAAIVLGVLRLARARLPLPPIPDEDERFTRELG